MVIDTTTRIAEHWKPSWETIAHKLTTLGRVSESAKEQQLGRSVNRRLDSSIAFTILPVPIQRVGSRECRKCTDIKIYQRHLKPRQRTSTRLSLPSPSPLSSSSPSPQQQEDEWGPRTVYASSWQRTVHAKKEMCKLIRLRRISWGRKVVWLGHRYHYPSLDQGPRYHDGHPPWRSTPWRRASTPRRQPAFPPSTPRFDLVMRGRSLLRVVRRGDVSQPGLRIRCIPDPLRTARQLVVPVRHQGHADYFLAVVTYLCMPASPVSALVPERAPAVVC